MQCLLDLLRRRVRGVLELLLLSLHPLVDAQYLLLDGDQSLLPRYLISTVRNSCILRTTLTQHEALQYSRLLGLISNDIQHASYRVQRKSFHPMLLEGILLSSRCPTLLFSWPFPRSLSKSRSFCRAGGSCLFRTKQVFIELLQ